MSARKKQNQRKVLTRKGNTPMPRSNLIANVSPMDLYPSVRPLNHCPPSKESWCDTTFANAAANTTFASISLLGPLINSSTGIFPSNLQGNRVLFSGNSTRYYKNIESTRIHMRMNLVGAQGNALLPADLFNFLRQAIFFTEDPFGGVLSQDPLTVNSDIDWREIKQVLYDKTSALSVQAFDSSNNGVPATEFVDVTIPFKHKFECINTSSSTTWDTKSGDIRFQYVSDSSVSPHPTFSGTLRLYYRELDQ